MKLRRAIALATTALAIILMSGCGHDAAWKNGYNYAIDNSGNASQFLVPGITNESEWCGIVEKYATAGPVGGNFVAGCEAGLHDAGVYP